MSLIHLTTAFDEPLVVPVGAIGAVLDKQGGWREVYLVGGDMFTVKEKYHTILRMMVMAQTSVTPIEAKDI